MVTFLKWGELKSEYLNGSIGTVSDFLRQKNIKRNGNSSRLTKGWSYQRLKYQEQLERAKREEEIKRVSQVEAEFVARRIRIARNLQFKALHSLAHQKPKTVMQSLKMLVDGLREEREALGLNKNSRLGNANDVMNPLTIAITNVGRYGQRLLKMNPVELRVEIDRLCKQEGENVVT